jgi:5-methylcytosine-specific restriction endonuclease McrA
MKKHVKVYLDYFNYGIDEKIPCEYCGAVAVDIAHITARSKFGSKRADERDDISNLAALCRVCHYKYDFENGIEKEELIEIHQRKLGEIKKK